MRILGIETSCDETGVALYDYKKGLIINNIYSHVNIHKDYGGIVPELSSRNHINNIILLIKKILINNKINAIAYTAGPGLKGSLITGVTISKALSYNFNIPNFPINHLEAHLLSTMLEINDLKFPFITLLITGNNTLLILSINIGVYKIIGESLDDSVGEAFDKIAKLLGINYPGGIFLSDITKYGISNRYIFPKSMIYTKELNFSFSGIKTFAKNLIKYINDDQTRADIAKGLEDSIIKIICLKCNLALDITGIKKLVITGGVSNNITLRKKILFILKNKAKIYFTPKEFCTDNAAMIAYTGMIRFLINNNIINNFNISILPNWYIY